MRKPLICAVAPLLAAATVSCSMISGYSTDEAASYARAVELVKTNVDTDKFKIYSIDFFEREALSDDLFLVSVKMVNRDDRAFSQTYYLNGLEPTDLDDVSFDAPKYETTAGIDPGTIDPEEIAAQIAALNGYIGQANAGAGYFAANHAGEALVSARLEGSADVAVGVNAGIMWDINSEWSLGMSWRSRMNMKVGR